MKALVIGGNRFFGVHCVNSLIARGHDVTVANRGLRGDNFCDKVKRIVFDRTDENSIMQNINDNYDFIIDNLNYTPNDTKRLLDNITPTKYIYTSSTAVYYGGTDLAETDFNPLNLPCKYGDRCDFEYNVGKRYAEAVAFQKYHCPITAVRFPVVLGEDDYTERLFFYVEHILLEKPINVTNFDTKLSFIDSEQAGDFLAFISEKDFTGAINAASDGFITIREIISAIEKTTDKKAVLSPDGEDCPYNMYGDCTVDCTKAKELSYHFRPINSYFCDIIEAYTRRILAKQR